jgi:hypothetical protein
MFQKALYGPQWLKDWLLDSFSIFLHRNDIEVPRYCRLKPNVTVLLRSTMQQAADSDGKVIQKLRDNTAAFAALNPEAAASQMPRLQAPLVPMGEDPALVVARLRRNMEALNALSNERAGKRGLQATCMGSRELLRQ